MQSMLNLRAIHGVPLCLSGITNPLSLSREMADHERRRKAMKKQRSSSSMVRESIVVHANQEQMVGILWNFERDSSSSSSIKGEGDNHKNNNRDLDDDVMHDHDDDDDLSHNTSFCCYLGSTAKAA
ncbi:hypothetical protein HN51_009989 [Arachis hypogaea]|uniref:Uncharacterized protein n=1 Tax=Arachis hypogaea TaxID=3818 RepID=A0A445E4S4_ARAHY|nr:uncharacterized protein LOC112786482 [Arachis hypogaea]QHO54977.1 uncharacterized protein DS421_3g61440 [Arachis hypogaea]RYR70345.1 hypothetical protein Ahy_A03g016841 [Arachis hypogaea]